MKILVVEDEPLILEELCDTLEDLDYEVVGKCMDGETALDALNHVSPDLVILDINLGDGISGIDLGRHLGDHDVAPFIYLTSYGDRATINEAKKTRPMGYIMKPFTEEDLLSAIEISMFNYSRQHIPQGLSLDLINGQILAALTEKEFEVLEGIFEGKSNAQIAEEHFISRNTVKTHIKNLYVKMDVHTRSELLARLRTLMTR
jgi:DNA-binding NarL/FixJ family response regulator